MAEPLVPRVLVVVCDSWGVGEAPDAHAYGDDGSNTLANTAAAVGGLRVPALEELGLGLLTPIDGVAPRAAAGTAHGRATEVSAGKDTTTGHWEMMGIELGEPFPLYPHGFPPEIIEPFERAIGRHVLGNIPASGTEIIAELGAEHLRTGEPIVYTSGDSVFQIACHKDVVPLGAALRVVRDRTVVADRPTSGRQGDRAAVRRPRGRVRPQSGTPGPRGAAAGPHGARRDHTGRPPGVRRGQDPGHLQRPRHHGGPLLRLQRRWRGHHPGLPVPAGPRLRVHEPRRLRLQVRAPERSARVRGGDRGLRCTGARAASRRFGAA